MKKILLALAMFFTVAISAQDKTWTGLWQQNSEEFYSSSPAKSTFFFAILDNYEEGLKIVNFSIYEEDTVELTIMKRDQYGFEIKLYNPDNNYETTWICKVLNENTIKVSSYDWDGILTLERVKII